jgi:glucosamine--fructose-6-phosphate aminotransferase (isomerizing)
MCGIVGYVGRQDAAQVILDGLQRLEYRGYDSAGLAVAAGGVLHVRRAVGRISALEDVVRERPAPGVVGIGHTRWATHGRPCEDNAHPHRDCGATLVVVHNGIVENYVDLKQRLLHAGHAFRSETDTEVLAHLVEEELARGQDLKMAVTVALSHVMGAYAVGVMSLVAPECLVVAKRGAGSVVVGLGAGETFVASDVPALLPYTRDVIVLEDGDVAVITATGVAVCALDGRPVRRERTRIAWDAAMAEKGHYPHFMLKEIYEQPRAIADTFRGRVSLGSGEVTLPEVANAAGVTDVDRVVLVACGTAYHAAMLGRAMIERFAGLAAEAELASEFRYRDAIVGPRTLVIAVSQSGETADTIGAVKAARSKGCPVIAVTNVMGSALAREATAVVSMQAGPEIGVASTKAFVTMLVALYLFGLWLGRERGALSANDVAKSVGDLVEIPALVEKALEVDSAMAALAREVAAARDVLYLGRGHQHAIALEGALKLKEISYIHAEGYAGGEMKHGPIALVTDGLPVVAIAPRDSAYDRMAGNIEEVRARGARIIAVTNAGDARVAATADVVVEVPATADLLAPLVTVVPLQFLAYHVAVVLGRDVDRPRNLAKSVTVE